MSVDLQQLYRFIKRRIAEEEHLRDSAREDAVRGAAPFAAQKCAEAHGHDCAIKAYQQVLAMMDDCGEVVVPPQND